MPRPGATVAVSTRGVASAPELGGHFWVYMQYVQGLREQGCEVYWIDRSDRTPPDPTFSAFFSSLKRYGLE